jgi:hypothetical protein
VVEVVVALLLHLADLAALPFLSIARQAWQSGK